MQRFRIGIACLVTTVWLAGYAIAYATGGQNPTELSGLMAVILGWAFAGQVRESLKRNGNGHDRRKDDE